MKWAPDEAFRVTAEGVCTKCKPSVRGWIAFNKKAQIVDSGGFMVFEDGLTSDTCLSEVHP